MTIGVDAVRSFPGQVVTGWGPFCWQILFRRDSIASGSTPFGPIARAQERQGKTEIQENGDQVSHFEGPSLIKKKACKRVCARNLKDVQYVSSRCCVTNFSVILAVSVSSVNLWLI
jgi:hypothetical protein